MSAPTPKWEVNATQHATELILHFQVQLEKVFPRKSSFRAQSFASTETCQFFKDLTTNKRAMKELRKVLSRTFLRAAFDVWKGRQWSEEQASWFFRATLYAETLGQKIQRGAKNLRSSLRTDRRAYLEKVVKEAADAPAHEMWQKLRPVLPSRKKNKPAQILPQVQKLDGTKTINRKEYQARWVQHFQHLEAGTSVSPEQLVRNAILRQEQGRQDMCFKLQDLPTLHQVEEAIRKTRTQRAAGPDSLPNEFFRCVPGLAAQVLWPLAMKFAVRLEEPVQFKGGQLFTLYKGKGPPTICDNFRGILLMSTPGKILRSAMRSHVNKPYLTTADSMQLANRPGLSVIFGAQAIGHFHAISKTRGSSSAIIFCDIKSAYYKVLREVSVGTSHADEDIAAIMRRLGLPPETMHTLAQALQGESAYVELGANQHQQAVLRESISDTWFSVFEDDFSRTTRGTRPGDSWADIIFNVTFHALIQQLRSHMNALDLWLHVPLYKDRNMNSSPLANQEEVAHVTWADDIAIPLVLAKARDTITKVPIAIDLLLTALEQRGMEANIGVTKTAALVTPRGPQAVKCAQAAFCGQECCNSGAPGRRYCLVPLVPSYKHLGGVLTAKGTMLAEIQARAARAKSAFWRAAKDVLRNERFSLESRMHIFQATVMSTFVWGAGAWPYLSCKEFAVFEARCWELYSHMLPKAFRKNNLHISHDDICGTLKVIPPQVVLHAARVRHFGPLTALAPATVFVIFFVWVLEHKRQCEQRLAGWLI